MRPAIYALLGPLLTIIASISAGTLLLGLLRVKLKIEEQRLLAFFAGSAVLSTLVFATAALHAVYKGVFIALTAFLVATAVWRRAWCYHDGPQKEVAREKWLVFGVLFALFGSVYFVKAWAPEHSPDGAMYHLGLVARYYRERGFQPIVTSMYAQLSQGAEMLFLFAYSLGRHSAAALVHCAFLFALPLAMLTFARRFLTDNVGLFAAALVFASPVFGIAGTSAYNDVALAAVAFALFWTLEIWRESPSRGVAAVAGLLAGFAFAIKYTGAFGVVLAIAYVWRRPKDLAVLLVSASLAGGPWLMKNAMFTGNPVAPLANSLFPNPVHYTDLETQFQKDMRTYDGVRPSELPFEVTVLGVRTGGLLGPLFLLAPLGLFVWRRGIGVRLLLAASLFAIPFAFNIGTRFLLPPAVFVALAIGFALRSWPRVLLAVAALHAVLSWPWFIPLYAHPGAWRISEFPLRGALRMQQEDEFLSRRSFPYVQARLIEMYVPPSDRVFAFGGMAADAYTSRELVVGFQSALGSTIRDVLLTPLINDLQPTRWLTFQFPPMQARGVRVCQTGTSPDVWSISEMRIFRAGVELARDPAWRLRAQPNPWQVQRAFDNSPVTRWSAHEPARPGMCIEAAFEKPAAFDSVRLEAPRDHYKVRLRLEAFDESWREVDATLDDADSPPLPQRNLRRAATEEAKLLGVRWLIVDDADFAAADLRRNAKDWGIKYVDSRGAAKLYYME